MYYNNTNFDEFMTDLDVLLNKLLRIKKDSTGRYPIELSDREVELIQLARHMGIELDKKEVYH